MQSTIFSPTQPVKAAVLAIGAGTIGYLAFNSLFRTTKPIKNSSVTVIATGKPDTLVAIPASFPEFLSEVKRILELQDSNIKISNFKGKEITTVEELWQHFYVFAGNSVRPPLKEIPSVLTSYPVVGHLPYITKSFSRELIPNLFRIYKVPFMKFYFGNYCLAITNDPNITQEILTKPQKFPKMGAAAANILRKLLGDALFSARDTEENWGIAHRILMPAFSQKSLMKYIPEIVGLAKRLVSALGKFSPEADIDIQTWMSKVTFDTIGLCGFGYDFRSLENEKEGAFSASMTKLLKAVFTEISSVLPSYLRPDTLTPEIKFQQEFVEDILKARTKEPEEQQLKHHDLLQLMLNGVDPETKKKLSHRNVVHQILTFLIAGHETTATTLAWAIYHIATMPQVEHKCLKEIDQVIGLSDNSEFPSEKNIHEFKYIGQVIRETLRLHAPAAFTSRNAGPVDGTEKTIEDFNNENYANIKTSKYGSVNLGDYEVPANVICSVAITALHLNEKYWPNPEKFDPDRFSPENKSKLHPFQFLPFSSGPRGCIGMQFSLIESTIVLVVLLKFKHIRLSEAARVEPVDVLTVRVGGLLVRLADRELEKPKSAERSTKSVMPNLVAHIPKVISKAPPITFLYGSNTGTARDIMYRIMEFAELEGFSVGESYSLDEFSAIFESRGASATPLLCIVTATYNGTPPDNAKKFDMWMSNAKGDIFSQTKFAIFGVGNSQWSTFQAFPRKILRRLSELGGKSIVQPAELDLDNPSGVEEILALWQPEWSHALQTEYNQMPDKNPKKDSEVFSSVDINVVNKAPESVSPGNNSQKWVVTKISELQSHGSDRRTTHIEFKIPSEDITYVTGDHFGVYPTNPPEIVDYVAKRLSLRLSDVIVIFPRISENSESRRQRIRSLPLNKPVLLQEILTQWIDLRCVPSRVALVQVAKCAKNENEKAQLLALSASDGLNAYKAYFVSEWRTFIDLLRDFPSVEIPLNVLLDILPRIQPRFYSISSSHSVHPHEVHITVGRLCEEIPNSSPKKMYTGVCSGYLTDLKVGSEIQGFHQKIATTFRLPEDPKKPIILVGAGTGIAPFRGFLYERTFQIRQRRQSDPKFQPGTCVLFYGVRRPDHDFLYKDELQEFQKDGTLTHLYTAFSRKPGSPKEYVQDLMLQNSSLVWELIDLQGAVIYVCGSARTLAKDMRSSVAKLVEISDKAREGATYFEIMKQKKLYLEDVWG